MQTFRRKLNLVLFVSQKKKILKNSEYNYQTFEAKDLDNKDLDKFDIESKKPETLSIKGLSLFLSDKAKINVKIVNKNIVLFKAIDQEKNYSESGVINRESGELVYEITRNINSEKSEKDISIYSCNKREENV